MFGLQVGNVSREGFVILNGSAKTHSGGGAPFPYRPWADIGKHHRALECPGRDLDWKDGHMDRDGQGWT